MKTEKQRCVGAEEQGWDNGDWRLKREADRQRSMDVDVGIFSGLTPIQIVTE